MMFTMIHHGMLIVGVPYSVPELLTTPQGGTPYGPSHTAGPESQNALIAEEIAVCKALGQRVAEISKKLKAGS
jgi:NAD(P)H dehydrogenase (quinone)